MLLALATVFSLTAPAFAEEEAEITEATEVEPVTAAATSGKCGDNVTWSFAGDTLTISGTGPMEDYDISYFNDIPWYPYLDSIKRVVIGNGVTGIGEWAFAYCESLASVTIPGSVISIGGDAFWGCSSLTSVTIPESVTSIGDGAFSDCWSLTGVTIPNSVTSIGWYAFGWCYSLTNVTIPDSVTSIGSSAFCYCAALTSVIVMNPNCTIMGPGGASDEGRTLYTLGDPSTTVILGYPGSTAEAYAKQYGNIFGSLVPEPTATPQPTAVPTPVPTATPKPQLAAPTVKIEKVSTGIKVSWNKIAGSPRYMVYYKEGNGGWTKIGTTTSTTYTRKAANLKNNVTYTFTVRCCENDKKTLLGPYKASNSLTYTAQLAAPTVKTAKVAGGIKVTWNKITGSPRYMVYYKEGNGGWKKIGTTTATTYTRAAKYLKNNVTYTFTVRCCANDKKTLLGPYKASNSITYKK